MLMIETKRLLPEPAWFSRKMGETMNRISLTSSRYTNCIVLPNLFIDEYMPSANGDYVKVYVYLVRCMQDLQSDITITAIADRLDNTEKDILRALSYWEKVGLLTLAKNADNEITAISLTDLSDTSSNSNEAATESAVMKESDSVSESSPSPQPAINKIISEPAPFTKPHYTESQINQITSDDEVKWMMNIIEVYLEHPLRPVDVQLIMYLYESLNFSRELIMYLYEYCISKGKKNASYIETVALAWHKEGIDTVEKAEASSAAYNMNYNAIAKAFGITNGLGAIQQQIINKWAAKYKFSSELMVEACNRTMLKTGKASFEYAESILESWFKQGVKSLKDIESLDAAYKKSSSSRTVTPEKKAAPKTSTNKFNAFPQREYSQSDYSDLEQKLMNLDYFANND